MGNNDCPWWFPPPPELTRSAKLLKTFHIKDFVYSLPESVAACDSRIRRHLIGQFSITGGLEGTAEHYVPGGCLDLLRGPSSQVVSSPWPESWKENLQG